MKEILDRILAYLDTLKPNLEPIGLITLGVGILTLFYAMRSYRLQRRSFHRAIEFEKQKEHKERGEREGLEAVNRRRVPDTISFGNEILITPTMKEAGIPKSLGYLGIFTPLIKKGDWVKRGDELLTVHYRVFPSEKPWWFMSDIRYSTPPISLKSPVSGLVIAFRDEYAGYMYYDSIEYRTREIFPVILLPKDEPPQETFRLCFYEDMIRNLNSYWPNIAYRQAYKYVRLREKDPEFEPEIIDKLALKDFDVRTITSSDQGLLRGIQDLRAYNTDLHHKLVHLG